MVSVALVRVFTLCAVVSSAAGAHYEGGAPDSHHGEGGAGDGAHYGGGGGADHEHHHGDGEGADSFAGSSFDGGDAGGTARWMAEQASWGSMTFVNKTSTSPSAAILPIAASVEDQGRIFLYLMGEQDTSGCSLTLSQASINADLFHVAGCGSVDSAVDAQDPRCIKATFTGGVKPCSGATCEKTGKAALFSKHPSMQNWPEDHHFVVHEFIVDSIWMISYFGGGSDITGEEYYAAETAANHDIEDGTMIAPPPFSTLAVPEWSDLAARARWVVYHSLWTTVSTRGNEDSTFGNIRSVTDGSDCLKSTGRPSFYLPDADPAAQDIVENPQIALSFTEASLFERVTVSGQTCGGEDAGSPTCAQAILYGTAIPLETHDPWYLEVLAGFLVSHPLAPWLVEGGSHMTGRYYMIEVNRIMLLDYYGGYEEVDVGEYLQFMPGSHQEYFQCNAPNVSSENGSDGYFVVAILLFLLNAVACIYVATRLTNGEVQYKEVPSQHDRKDDADV